MARFDVAKTQPPGVQKTVNLAGGAAFTRSAKAELASLALTSMLSDTFYEKGGEQLERLQRLVGQLAQDGDLKFAAQAAIYTRHTHGLRTISHALAGEVARQRYLTPSQRGDWGARFFAAVVRRPDDMAEIERIANFSAELRTVDRVDVLPFHQMGRYKWEKLNMEYPLKDTQPPSQQVTKQAVEIFRAVGLHAV